MTCEYGHCDRDAVAMVTDPPRGWIPVCNACLVDALDDGSEVMALTQ
jgi:hypothetical protein